MDGGTIQLRRPDYPAKQRNGQRNLAMTDSDVNRHASRRSLAKRERIVASFRASLKRLKSAAVFLKRSNRVPSDASHNGSHEIVCTRIAKPVCRRHCRPQ